MAEQLTILGLWERTPDGAPAQEELVLTVAPAPVPVDPRQVDLLTGSPMFRAKLEEACAALDAPGVRDAHSELNARFLDQKWADRAPAWADTIEWLEAGGSAGEQAARAVALVEDAFAASRLPDAPGRILRLVRDSAMLRAAERLTAEHGAAARLPDGRPAAVLLVLAGAGEAAFDQLRTACELNPDPKWLGLLAGLASARGATGVAFKALVQACVIDPEALDFAALECAPFLELLDQAEELELPAPSAGWVPVLAELRGSLPLSDSVTHAGFAALLHAYRKKRASLDDPARIAAKRALVRAAPGGLRELLRSI